MTGARVTPAASMPKAMQVPAPPPASERRPAADSLPHPTVAGLQSAVAPPLWVLGSGLWARPRRIQRG